MAYESRKRLEFEQNLYKLVCLLNNYKKLIENTQQTIFFVFLMELINNSNNNNNI